MMRSDPFDEALESNTSSGSAVALGVVPLAIPIMAGPGAISTIVLLATGHEAEGHRVLVTLVLILVGFVILGTLWAAAALERFLTKTVNVIFNKVMGLVICAISFEFMLDGIAAHFPDLRTIHDIATPALGG